MLRFFRQKSFGDLQIDFRKCFIGNFHNSVLLCWPVIYIFQQSTAHYYTKKRMPENIILMKIILDDAPDISCIIFTEYIYIFRKSIMDSQASNNRNAVEAIWIYQPCQQSDGSLDIVQNDIWEGIPYLKKGDSMMYISQFLTSQDEQIMCCTEEAIQEEQLSKNSQKSSKESKTQILPPCKFKKIEKVANSPFHNYQKHLNNALKKLIVVPAQNSEEQVVNIVAQDIWNKYVEKDIKTKKILHFVFNEQNEHRMCEVELRKYGLIAIYHQHGEEIYKKAKCYLSRLAIDQINQTTVKSYLKTRKLKRSEGLLEYILNFKKELVNGYLKRRINLGQLQN